MLRLLQTEQQRLHEAVERRKIEEEEARKIAEEEARKKAEEEARKRAEEAACKKAEEAARKKAEEEAQARKLAEEQARRRAEEAEARKLAEEQARKREEEQARRLAEEQARKREEERRIENERKRFRHLFVDDEDDYGPTNQVYTDTVVIYRTLSVEDMVSSTQTANSNAVVPRHINANELLLKSLMKQVNKISAVQLHKGLKIAYDNEPGVGQGPLREFLTFLSELLFVHQTHHLFQLSPDLKSIHITPIQLLSQHLSLPAIHKYYKFVGKFLGLSLINGVPIGVKLSNGILKYLLGQEKDLNWTDLEHFDEKMFHTFQGWMDNTPNQEFQMHQTYGLHFVIYDDVSKSE
ncbi:kinetoplast-associated protein, partial [Reticulomyxa filosa]